MAESDLDTVTASQKQFQHTLELMGERLDQIAALHETRDQKTEKLHNEMAASLRVFQDVIASLDTAVGELGRATAALIEIERRQAARLAQQQQQQ